MNLHLTRQGATLRLRQGRLLLEAEGETLASFPARQVRRVAVWALQPLPSPGPHGGVPGAGGGRTGAFRLPPGQANPRPRRGPGGGRVPERGGQEDPPGLLEERFLQEATHPLGFRKPYQELIEVQAHRLEAAILGRERVVSRVMCKSLCTGGIPLLKHLLQHLLHLREPL